MTPEQRREELRRKAGLAPAGQVAAPQAVHPELNITNTAPEVDPRHSELRAKAGIDTMLEAQFDPALKTYRVPERLFGMDMPFAGGEVDVVSDASQGYQIAIPAHAPEGVRRAIVEGVQRGHTARKERDGLSRAGRATLDAWGPVGPRPVLAPPAATFNSGGSGSGGEAFERVGAASIGSLDLPSFGTSDELAGFVFGDQAKENARGNIEAAWKHHPASTFVGGSPSLFIPGQTARGVTTGQRLLSTAWRGGTVGGLYGFGSGEGDALSADRWTKAGAYGTGGAVLGGSFVLGGRGLEYAGRNILGSAEVRAVASHLFGNGSSPGTIKLVDQAITEVQRAARVEGREIARDVAKQELTAALQRAQANDMIGDLIPGGVTSMEGSALPGMEGADLVVSKLSQRGEGQYERINRAVGNIVDGQDIEGSLANLAAIKSEEARPLYNAAFATDKVIDPAHPRYAELARLVQLDDFKRGRAAGERVWRLEMGDGEAQFASMNPFEQLDWIKKGLDSEIGKTLRAGDDTTARALIGAKNRMLAIADEMNPDYAQARQVWAGAEGQREALMLGESLINSSGQVKTGQQIRDIRNLYDGYSESEKTAFSIGLFEKAINSVGTVAETALSNSAKRGFLSPNTRRELQNFLPEEQADEFLDMMEREFRQQMNANQALAGSPTGRRIKAGEAVRMATGGARAAAAELSDPQGLLRKGQQKIRETIGNNPKVQKRFAEFLTQDAQNPDLLRALGIQPRLSPPTNSGTPLAPPATPSGTASPQAAAEASQRTVPGDRGFMGRRLTPDTQLTDYGFKTSGGNDIKVTASQVDNSGSLSIDWITNGQRAGGRPDGLPTQSLGETNEILSGVEGAVRRIIADKSPREIVLAPRTDQHERIYRAMLERADLGPYTLGQKNTSGGPALVLTRSGDTTPAARGRDSERGMISIDGGPPRRRREVMRDVRGRQFPAQQAARPEAPPPPRQSALQDSPLPVLAGAGAVGTAGVAGYNHMTAPSASTAEPSQPGKPQFMPGLMNAFQAAHAAQQARSAAGLPPPPRVKPNLSSSVDASNQRSNQGARQQEAQRRQEYVSWLRQKGGGNLTVWTRAHEERAEDLKVTPEDRRRGVSSKRLAYDYTIPVEELENAPIEILINGQWMPESALEGAR